MSAVHLTFRVLIPLLLINGCSRSGKTDPDLNAAPEAVNLAATPDSLPLVTPYPYAAWRLGDRGELEHVVLWFSHILVRFDGAKTDEVNFNLASWYSVLPPPTRTRAQAFALAEEIAEKASLDASTFPELAREYSEDITTKDSGGSLGGVTASQLTPWPQVLDALAALKPGQSSRVVETWYGFHVFYRSPPPLLDKVSGSHIVIAHDQAGWLSVLARGRVPRRSRAEALSLANEVYALARENPEQFEELVGRYSEHRSATVKGDFGSYSTHEPNPYPRQVEALGKLAVGEVAPPMDSPVGFEIIRRTRNRPRQQVAMDSLWLRFDPSAIAPSATSQASVRAQATAFAERIAGDPARFKALQGEACCTYVQQWAEGRGSPPLTLALQQLQVGQLTAAPIETESYYVLAKRIEPSQDDPPEPQLDLPAPETPDLTYHLTNMQGSFAAAQLLIVGEKAQAILAPSGSASRQLLKLHDVSEYFSDSVDVDARQTALTALQSGVRQLLGDEDYSRYLAILQSHFKEYLLNPAHETAIARLPSGT